MNPRYKNICSKYPSGEELMNAIVSNRADVYYSLTELVIFEADTYRSILKREGRSVADRLLVETFLALRRQVSKRKLRLTIQEGTILTSKENSELLPYLDSLYSLIFMTSNVNPRYKDNQEAEQRMVRGSGLQKIMEIKGMIQATLNNCGCKDPEDREEIYDECLLLFWKKLSAGEIGIYLTGSDPKPENCRVYHRRFYQNSKLSTYLTGVAKNLFMNRTRTAVYQISGTDLSSLPEKDELSSPPDHAESSVLLLFMYYRMYVEERKLRTVVSLLQYDCNLDDREVRSLLGINNARIHSSRLRAGFAEWHKQNIHRIPELIDTAGDYLRQCESKKILLNAKILTIDRYRRSMLKFPDLKLFSEEFRSIPEFKQHYHIFRYTFYFAAAGKTSSLTGLPDEKKMKELMENYKRRLEQIACFGILILLLFYGTDEPVSNIILLLEKLSGELLQLEPSSLSDERLRQQLRAHLPDNEEGLADDLYQTNQTLFRLLSREECFAKLT